MTAQLQVSEHDHAVIALMHAARAYPELRALVLACEGRGIDCGPFDPQNNECAHCGAAEGERCRRR